MKHSKEWWRRRIDPDFGESYWNSQDSILRIQMMDMIKTLSFESILEVGCANGPNLALIQREFPDVKIAGIDINPGVIEYGRKKLPKADLKVAEAEDLPYPNDSFDIVFTNAVLLDSEDIDKAVSEIKRVVKKWVILVELHTLGIPKKWGNHTIRNYGKYFKGCSLTKIEYNEEPWLTHGYIIKWLKTKNFKTQ